MWEALQNKWTSLSTEMLQKTVDTIPRIYKTVSIVRGGSRLRPTFFIARLRPLYFDFQKLHSPVAFLQFSSLSS